VTAWDTITERTARALQPVFGRSVTYYPITADPYTFVAIAFDEVFQSVEMAQAQVQVASRNPVLDVYLDDMSTEPEEGDELVVASKRYQVDEIQPSGNGDAKLILSRVVS